MHCQVTQLNGMQTQSQTADLVINRIYPVINKPLLLDCGHHLSGDQGWSLWSKHKTSGQSDCWMV